MIPLLDLLQERSWELHWVWGTTVATGSLGQSVSEGRVKIRKDLPLYCFLRSLM